MGLADSQLSNSLPTSPVSPILKAKIMTPVAANLQGLFVDALGSTSMSVRIVERKSEKCRAVAH